MKLAEAQKLIETVGADTGEKLLKNMIGEGKTARLLTAKATLAAGEKAQQVLPGIEGVTDGLITKTVAKVKARSKGNLAYAQLYADVPASALPLADAGYEQERVFSQHRNGHHVIFKAMHALNIQHRRGVTVQEIYAVLQSAPKCGGWAHFIGLNTLRAYICTNRFGLWHKVAAFKNGMPGVWIYVAAGLSDTCETPGKVGRKKKAV